MFLFGDQGKTFLAWSCSRDSLAELTRNGTFAWPFSSVSRVSQFLRNFCSLEDCRRYLEELSAAKGISAVERWNGKLPERDQRPVEWNGDDIVQL